VPARLNLTPDQFEQRVREQTRLRVKRYRERRNAAPINEGSVTTRPNGALKRDPPHTPPSPPLSLEREIREALEPLTARGYVHDPRFWVLASEQYPALCLELEALKLVDWLQEPKNARRRCSKAFLDNWLKKAEADRKQAEAAQAKQANGVASPRGVVTNGTYHPPITQQHNRQPDAPHHLNGELVPISKDDFERTVAARRAIPLPERLAALRTSSAKGGKP
jgi:hypothetical protein